MSQRSQLVLKLREMILTGRFQPGERLAEEPVAAALGVSRTPIRSALEILAREGLVTPTANQRGYVVREVTLKEILDATELRGVLEGVAARQVAEAGLSDADRGVLEDCIACAAAIFEKNALTPDDGGLWAEQNERFHRTIIEASGNAPLIHALKINDQTPFSSAGAFLEDRDDPEATRRQYAILLAAQRHHETVLACLVRGEGARAEALMREHCFLAVENITLFRAGLGDGRLLAP
ncbi:GntR family transcriptional regulator [Phenylobacterium montanum]|uniref:GntR family transcriptional regulator n=1 Tax=Phenylobacterium montanum TaxID=2823693 RepID=A0A975IW96_9CAUL|nr:GntR family transcriptional regulator [Caulobacter sp. S6]QUD89643.1 GntR family transcriptional regulator [Caulobacter sp. S6]